MSVTCPIADIHTRHGREHDRRSLRTHAAATFLLFPLLSTLPRRRQGRPFVLLRILRSLTWLGNLRETLSGCHDRPALRLKNLLPRTFARQARSLRSVAHPDRGPSGPDRRWYEERVVHRS